MHNTYKYLQICALTFKFNTDFILVCEGGRKRGRLREGGRERLRERGSAAAGANCHWLTLPYVALVPAA